MAYTTIDDPSAYFKVQLWTGDDVDPRTITFDDTDTDMAPDFIWIKLRPVTHAHKLYDTVRGVNERHLVSDENSAETTGQPSDGYMSATTSDGFTINKGSSTWWNGNNSSHSSTYVAWCWKESATSGFDIVAYTGNGTDDTDISHNLSAVPKMIIVKNRDAADSWQVYHSANTAAPETDYLVLDTKAETADAADRWSDEAPTSSVFTLGDGNEVNTNTENYIAYLFAEKQGFSRMGSYVGNGNADGIFVYLGFRPAWIMIKYPGPGAGYDWKIYDSKRDSYNGLDTNLDANENDAEPGEANMQIDYLSNGFKCRNVNSNYNDASGTYTYLYMAFAEAPFVNSNGVPCNAR